MGRPRARGSAGVWSDLTNLIAKGPPTLEAAIGAAAQLGFSLHSSKGDHARLEQGKLRLRLETKHLGERPALEIELEGPDRHGKTEERSGVVFQGTTLPKKLFHEMKERFAETLDDFEDALAARSHPLPTDFDSLKAFIEDGKSEKAQEKEAAEDAEIAAQLAGLTLKLESLANSGLAPRGVIVYVDGPDGAGKSSTGAILMRALEDAGYSTGSVSFKAPTEAERKQHWLQRFRDHGVPGGDQGAMFWDRGPGGDTVYAPRTPEQVASMAKELKALERELAADGILLFKLHLWAEPEKQAATFGKRFARQTAASRIGDELAKKHRLTPSVASSLEAIRDKIDGDDLRALVQFPEVQRKFLRFSKLTGAKVIDATKRHEARLEVIDTFGAQLDAFAKAQKKAPRARSESRAA
ncbi:MAG: hypothetical protein IT384_16865 [Deltaproteobacteria bacterium]|nr:hypothetical protein [Deltaproteobacteria bacterium]